MGAGPESCGKMLFPYLIAALDFTLLQDTVNERSILSITNNFQEQNIVIKISQHEHLLKTLTSLNKESRPFS